ncbi:hypothetical protein K0M31_008308 [Melipona bicolor]|uniref:Uncharacterized protein n=1 Tax=Melipona bicolor TaxID=60889 RepID=A0AA40KKE5_9HYME|nr:hypothetical protein K0M31_008308 [Melipona bicolor]
MHIPSGMTQRSTNILETTLTPDTSEGKLETGTTTHNLKGVQYLRRASYTLFTLVESLKDSKCPISGDQKAKEDARTHSTVSPERDELLISAGYVAECSRESVPASRVAENRENGESLQEVWPLSSSFKAAEAYVSVAASSRKVQYALEYWLYGWNLKGDERNTHNQFSPPGGLSA